MEFCANCGFRDHLCRCSSPYGHNEDSLYETRNKQPWLDENEIDSDSSHSESESYTNQMKFKERSIPKMSDKATCSRCQSSPCCCPINNNPTNTNTFNPVINITPGATEPPPTANNALIGLNATTPVQPNTPIPLDTNQVINGSSITHVPSSPIINLEPNQTYLVEYSVYGTAPEGSGLNAALRLNQNTIIPFSEATNDFNFVSPTASPMGASGGAIFNTIGNTPNTLEVLNLAPTGPTIFVNRPPFFRAVSVRIVKLS